MSEGIGKLEQETLLNHQEKPPFLYHGSLTAGIKELEPRERHKPDENIGSRIYATPLPGWAVAHSFPWSSDEGFDANVEGDNMVVLVVPKGQEERLNVPVYIYKVLGDNFNKTKEEGTGNTFDSKEKVSVIGVEKFNSVTEALKHFRGKAVFIDKK